VGLDRSTIWQVATCARMGMPQAKREMSGHDPNPNSVRKVAFAIDSRCHSSLHREATIRDGHKGSQGGSVKKAAEETARRDR